MILLAMQVDLNINLTLKSQNLIQQEDEQEIIPKRRSLRSRDPGKYILHNNRKMFLINYVVLDVGRPKIDAVSTDDVS